VLVAGAGFSVLNTLLLSVLDRRRELGILRAIGGSRRMIGRTIAVEALAIAAIGGAIGIFYGLYFHYLGIGIVDRTQGVPADFRFTPVPIAFAVIGAAVVAAVGASLPARRAARLTVVDAIGYE
jgi:putative ABC transport system permease protein